MSDRRQSTTGSRFIVMSTAEVDALFELVMALDNFIPRHSALRTAGDKLDEQIAAQMRDPYDEAKDELQEAVAMYVQDWEYEAMDFDAMARKVVDRIMGVYEDAPSEGKH